MKTLRTKLIRDLLGQKWQVLAVVSVTFLGVALFVGSYLAYEDLRGSYAATQERTNLADMTLEMAGVSSEQVAEVAAVPGVAEADSRLVLSWPLTVPNGVGPSGETGRILVEARLISLPPGPQSGLNQIVVEEGAYPSGTDEILVERHFADYHHLRPGSTLIVQTAAGMAAAGLGDPTAAGLGDPTAAGATATGAAATTERVLAVSGIAVSPEYLWVARSRQEFITSPADFGVFFAPRETLAEVTGVSADNRLLYNLEPGADADEALARVKEALGPGAVLAATPRAKLVGIELLNLDVEGLREMAVAFPFFFLAVAAFIVAAMMSRRIEQERPLIGTLLAVGHSPGAVQRHYASYAILVGLAGSLAGAAAGAWMGGAMAAVYAEELKIPFVTTHITWWVVAAGIGLGVVALVIPGIWTARRASAIEPAEAMRPLAPAWTPRAARTATLGSGQATRGPGQAKGGRPRLPLWLRLPLRDVWRHPGRSLGTAAGVAAALTLIVATGGMLDSIDRGVTLISEKAWAYDFRVDFLAPQPAGQLIDQVRSGNGSVDRIQAVLTLPAQVEANGETYNTMLEGLPVRADQADPDQGGTSPAGPSLLNPLDAAGEPISPMAGKAVLSATIAGKLDVAVGDTIRVKLLPDGPETSTTIGALSTALVGNSVVLPIDEARELLARVPGPAGDSTGSGAGTASGDLANTVVLTVDPGATATQRTDLRKALQAAPGVARLSDLDALRQQVMSMLGLAILLLGFMLIFAVILAASILFNTATLSVLERRRELATLRSLGMRTRRVAWLVTVENGVMCLLGLIVGFPLAWLALVMMARLFASDLFALSVWIYPRTAIAAVVGIVLTLLVAQWPALRQVSRMNLAEATKAKE